jgi:hypothetical protein
MGAGRGVFKRKLGDVNEPTAEIKGIARLANYASCAVSAAKRTQFLREALASYMAVSAEAMSCCGDCAWAGKEATPKEAVRRRRRPARP